DLGAQDLLRAALRARPREVVLHHALGNLLAGQLRWREAAERYATVRALRPGLGGTLAPARGKARGVREGPGPFRRLSAERKDDPWVHLHAGFALFNDLPRHKEAEAAFQQAIRLKRDHPTPHYSLGIALNAQGRDKEAEAAYQEAIRLKHDFREAHSNLGVVLHTQGRHKEAEAAYQEAIRLRHDLPEAHSNLGAVLHTQGRHKEAVAAYR